MADRPLDDLVILPDRLVDRLGLSQVEEGHLGGIAGEEEEDQAAGLVLESPLLEVEGGDHGEVQVGGLFGEEGGDRRDVGLAHEFLQGEVLAQAGELGVKGSLFLIKICESLAVDVQIHLLRLGEGEAGQGPADVVQLAALLDDH